jgi:uncharacterized protein YndB with AHSA1/START domain
MGITRSSELARVRRGSVPKPWLPGLSLLAGAGLTYGLVIRPWQLRWGATPEEARTLLPGDDLVVRARYVTTRAVTINAPVEAVWPWLVQLGQGRGGFYTYDRLEQLVGAAIRSADRIVPELQQLAAGDTVRLSPVGGPKVAMLEPARALVLYDTMDPRTSRSIPPGTHTSLAMDWSWSFTLRPAHDGATRLLVRTRADFRPGALLGPAVPILLEPVHFVMERGMLLGIKRRAEAAGRPLASGLAAAVIENETDITRSAEEVFDYCTDLTHEPEWNPKLRRVDKVTAGPVGVGTRFEAEFVPGDPMLIECVRSDRPTRWAMVGNSRHLTANFEGHTAPTEDGTHLVMRMEVQPHGLLRIALPLLSRYMQPQQARNVATIKARLEHSEPSRA